MPKAPSQVGKKRLNALSGTYCGRSEAECHYPGLRATGGEAVNKIKQNRKWKL
jgi:hypothetical protein